MKSTFYTSRQAILRSDDAVTNKLEKYSALKMPPLVNFAVFSTNISSITSLPFLLTLCLPLHHSLSLYFFPSSFFLLSFFYFFMTFIPLQRIY